MNRLTSALLSASLLAAAPGCLEASRPIAVATDTTAALDSVGLDTSAVDTATLDTLAPDTLAPCSGEGSCAHLDAPPCQSASCVDGHCALTYATTETACGDAVVGGCAGTTYHPPGHCDGAGQCLDAIEVPCPADPTGCAEATCDPTAGCGTSPKEAGTPCSVEDASAACVAQEWHAQDRCDANGVCVDGGSERCQAGFCELPVCSSPAGCSVQPIGVAANVAGDWYAFYLRYVDAAVDSVDGARTRLSLNATGLWSRSATELISSGVGGFPAVLSGAYCAGDSGAVQMELGVIDGTPNVFFGRMTPARNFFFAASHRRAELLVGVRQGMATADASVRNRGYRLLGLVKTLTGADLYAVDGTVVFDSDGCVKHDAPYRKSNQTQPIVIDEGSSSCLTIASNGAASFPHLETGSDGVTVSVRLSGQAFGDADVIVLTTEVLGATAATFPSLLFLIREEPDATPSSLDGRYSLAGLERSEVTRFVRVEAEVGYDGAGFVTAFNLVRGGAADIVAGGTAADRYTVASHGTGPSEDDALVGRYDHTVAVASTVEHHGGQIAPHAAGSGADGQVSSIVIYVGITGQDGLAASLLIGVRAP